jgi:anti-sigma-K factor RskA
VNRRDNDRITELLADRATQGLWDEELDDLRNLWGNNQENEFSDFDLAAAAVTLHSLRNPEPLPARLRTKLEADAQQWFAENSSTANNVVAFRPKTVPLAATPAPVVPFPVRRAGFSQRAGWFLAAAASLALAMTFAWPYLNGRANPTQQRARLLAQGGDLVALNWAATGIPEGNGVTGDVVWSQSQQTGFMRFNNLKPNNPQQYTYQLWIFDSTRDERFPVDGGYFDVPANQTEVVVPIKAKLPVNQAALFALTIEPPGGVVVSKREKIVVVAKN